MCSFDKFIEQLPSREKFYSSLVGKKVCDKEYEHDLKVWNKFKIKTMNDIATCT